MVRPPTFVLWCACAVLGATSARAERISAYFGDGCFWARQHTFVTELEQAALNRSASELTAIAGYAGGNTSSAACGATLCYENENATCEYGSVGAAEVVSLLVDDADGSAAAGGEQTSSGESELGAAARTFFETFARIAPGVYARPDVFDAGAKYRALVGVPGGLDGPHGAALRAANAAAHNMTLKAGRGADADTLGENAVWVLDSEAFPATQAELCLQFHDDASAQYPPEYHALRAALVTSGRLANTSCPHNYVC